MYTSMELLSQDLFTCIICFLSILMLILCPMTVLRLLSPIHLYYLLTFNFDINPSSYYCCETIIFYPLIFVLYLLSILMLTVVRWLRRDFYLLSTCIIIYLLSILMLTRRPLTVPRLLSSIHLYYLHTFKLLLNRRPMTVWRLLSLLYNWISC